MKITIPELSLVVLIGPSGCGKSTFARKHFMPTEVVSSDFCRGLVADDENDQSRPDDAFDLLHVLPQAAGPRPAHRGRRHQCAGGGAQAAGRAGARIPCLPVAIVFDLPEKLCHERNAGRPDRQFGPHVVRNQIAATAPVAARTGARGLSPRLQAVLARRGGSGDIERQPLWNNRKQRARPVRHHRRRAWLLRRIARTAGAARLSGASARAKEFAVTPPDGRKLIFVGDLVDRGPRRPRCCAW